MQTDRIRVLEPLLGAARRLRIWAEEESQTSGWEVQFDIGRFFLMVSPEVYRGFSGEGQVLEKLATGQWEEALPQVQAQLTWQAKIDVNDLADRTGIEKSAVESALAVLGSRGIAGYDVATGTYFHRVLPFELEKVEVLQPRLQGARKLLAEKKIKLISRQEKDHYEYAVEGSGVTHSVRISDDTEKCTCPWFSKHQGQRGPCKHILAARMVLEEGESS
jgi:hypothetical protein